MRQPVDSLFGRLTLLFVGVLLLSHVAWFALMRLERSQMQTRYAVEEAAFLVDAVRQHVAREPDQPLPSRVQLVEPASAAVPPDNADLPEPLRRFVDDVRERMPAGTDVRIGPPGRPPTLWVKGPQDARWIVVPVQPLRPMRPTIDRMIPWLLIIFSAAVIAALVAAWTLQKPLSLLAQAVARFGRGEPVPPVRERGPRELRLLTRGFNQMVTEVERNEHDRAVMLAGVAHDLKTPLARLRLRAEMMDEARARDGVVRDVDSMAHIVDQFLVFAHDGADRSEPVEVDEQCERIVRNYRTMSAMRAFGSTAQAAESPTIQMRLTAGSDFRLPAATLDRVVSNLLDNAHAYGAPPVVIETERSAESYTLTVRDHGKGIETQDLTRASRPFVRLDPARGGNGHSGLGLAIVERLVRRAGGELEIGNGEGGGLAVRMTFPVEVVQRTVAEAAHAW
ncbi:ATP-binding protein [Paraburkholderia ferrariae]|uniref:ATP-binding protein n=1 Tax=Paraburkholderia ferrariae TaxID=386056 RepID=UPI0004828EC1|nr:ATP-binding protein [Paraburkholderia ferrariae]